MKLEEVDVKSGEEDEVSEELHVITHPEIRTVLVFIATVAWECLHLRSAKEQYDVDLAALFSVLGSCS